MAFSKEEYDLLRGGSQGVSRWNDLRRARPSDLPDLSGFDLVGAELVGVDLEAANLRGAALQSANLEMSLLMNAVLSTANLKGAKLTRSRLAEADLTGADLTGIDLSGADLTKAKLSEAELRGANLSGANLSGANLSGANLSGANLSGANLSGANLSWTDLTESNLTRADLTNTRLDGANFTGANLDDANFGSANWEEANLSGTNSFGARFSWKIRNDHERQMIKDRVRRGYPELSEPIQNEGNPPEQSQMVFEDLPRMPQREQIEAERDKLSESDRVMFDELARGMTEHLGSHAAFRIWLCSPVPGYASTPLAAIRDGHVGLVLAVQQQQWGMGAPYA